MDASKLKHNVRLLLNRDGLTQKDAAEKIGVSYRWMPRICSRGLTRCEGRNEEALEKVRLFFGLESVWKLWSDRIPEQNVSAERYAEKLTRILRDRPNDQYVQEILRSIDGVIFWNEANAIAEAIKREHPAHFRMFSERYERDVEQSTIGLTWLIIDQLRFDRPSQEVKEYVLRLHLKFTTIGADTSIHSSEAPHTLGGGQSFQ